MGKHSDDHNGHKKVDPTKIGKPSDDGGRHSKGNGGSSGGSGGKR